MAWTTVRASLWYRCANGSRAFSGISDPRARLVSRFSCVMSGSSSAVKITMPPLRAPRRPRVSSVAHRQTAAVSQTTAVSQKRTSSIACSIQGVDAVSLPESSDDEAPHGSGSGELADTVSPAKKRRYSMDTFENFEVDKVLAVKGGRLKEKIALKTISVEGMDFTPMKKREGWISMTLLGKADDTGRYGFGLMELKRRVLEATTTVNQDDESALFQAAKQGVRALEAQDIEQSDTSDEEVAAAEAAHAKALRSSEHTMAQKSRAKLRKDRKIVKKIDVMEEEICFCIVRDVLHVQADARSMGTVIKYFRSELHVPDVLRERRATAASQRRPGGGTSVGQQSFYGLQDRSRVFLESRNKQKATWRVVYVNAMKKRKFWSKGLTFATDASDAECAADRMKKLAWARLLWNLLDKGDKPRYAISQSDAERIRVELRCAHVYSD